MKKIFKNLSLGCLIVLTSTMPAITQNDRPVEERIEAQRIAFITQRVNLTPEEAQSFWPIYNEYREKEKQLKESRITKGEVLDMDEREAENYLNKLISLEQDELNLKKEYTQKLKSVISSKKILRFYAAERMFKERLLQAMNQRRDGARN